MKNDNDLLLNYSDMLDMDIVFDVDLGNTHISVADFLQLEKGSIIDLEKPAGESVEVYVNQRIVGRGEVMVYEKNLAIRINEILSADAVLYYFSTEK